MPQGTSDHRRATAERSIEAILDAVENLLERGSTASITGVAAEAGVSRVTVYSHFPTREALLEAAAERVVERFRAALFAVDLEHGPPLEALEALIAAAWVQQDRFEAFARPMGEHLSSAARARTHKSLHQPLLDLIARGQREGAFRDDLPAGWLMAGYFALMHAYGDGVRAGELKAKNAVPTLQKTIRALFARPGAGPSEPR